jgi:coenzyme F420 hydrogenase subunit beta
LTSSKPWLPVPKLATTREEIISSAGTRYTFSPNILALKGAVEQGLKNVAFVGTPCQIQAIRAIQKVPFRKYGDIVKFTVGLFCSESFTYEGLMLKEIQGNLGIDLNRIKNINIKGKLIITTEDGAQHQLSLKEAKKHSEKKCNSCTDFSAELADLSVGGVGLDGRTLTIVRTDRGNSLLKNAIEKGLIETESTDGFQSAVKLLIKLSEIKRKNI